MSDRRIPFTAEDEDRIASASLWGIIAAVTGMLSGLVNAVTTVMPPKLPMQNMVTQSITLLVSVVLGTWLIQACRAFRAVARTDVADKAFLLRGFDKLHAYFKTIGILFIIGVVVAIVGVILFLVFGSRMAAWF